MNLVIHWVSYLVSLLAPYFRQECPRLCAQAPCSPLPVASALIWPVLSLGRRRRRPPRRAQGLELACLMGLPSPLLLWTLLFRTWCPPLTTTLRYLILHLSFPHHKPFQSASVVLMSCKVLFHYFNHRSFLYDFCFSTESLCVCLLTERTSFHPSIGAAGQGVWAVHQTAAAGPEPTRYGQHCTTRKRSSTSGEPHWSPLLPTQFHVFSRTDLNIRWPVWEFLLNTGSRNFTGTVPLTSPSRWSCLTAGSDPSAMSRCSMFLQWKSAYGFSILLARDP